MNIKDIDTLLSEGLTLKHAKLMLYLRDSGDSDYVQNVIEETDMLLRFIERCWEERPEIFKKVKLRPVSAFGSTRPRDTGIQLTARGAKLSRLI